MIQKVVAKWLMHRKVRGSSTNSTKLNKAHNPFSFRGNMGIRTDPVL